MQTCVLRLLPGEAWYGLCTQAGTQMPITHQSTLAASLLPNASANQANPLLVSSQGRYVYSAQGFSLKVEGGVIKLSAPQEIALGEGFGDLKHAYLAACKAHFPPTGALPPEDFFIKPQYNTWIELMFDQTQRDILNYARSILDNGLPPGILMIDDNWNRNYGDWNFRSEVFPDPKGMVDQLHQWGFEVMLWVCPFISPDSRIFRELQSRGLLVRNASGETAIRAWWNGYSGVLDLSNPEAEAWFRSQLDALMERFGIDGFKFDAGDAYFYRDDDLTFGKVSANGQSELWARLGLYYPYNEYRACFGCGGQPLVQRLSDKAHSWDRENGMGALVPNMLSQGIQGYAFGCPDMIGGGEFQSFLKNSDHLDQELFVRYAQCAALMPMMQFSAAPWRVLSPEMAHLCLEAAHMHRRMAGYIIELAHQAALSGAPIVRYLEYEFPHQGFERVIDQFMLGERFLVCPVQQKGVREMELRLPDGRWRDANGQILEGTVRVPAPLETLVVLERLDF